MKDIDYPKVKDEIIESHKDGVETWEIIDNVMIKYGFERSVITPIIQHLIYESNQPSVNI